MQAKYSPQMQRVSRVGSPHELPHQFHGQVSQVLQHLPQTMSLVVYVCSKSDVRVDMVVAVMPIPMDESIYQIVRHLQLTLHLHEVSIHPIFTAMMLLETGRWHHLPIVHHFHMQDSRYASSTLDELRQQQCLRLRE